MDEKLTKQYAYLKTDDFYFGIINTFMLSLYIQNLMRHLIINHEFKDDS